MARGKSGRIVLEIDPELKRRLYITLENRQQTMKEWFISEAQALIYGGKQFYLFDDAPEKSQNNKTGDEK